MGELRKQRLCAVIRDNRCVRDWKSAKNTKLELLRSARRPLLEARCWSSPSTCGFEWIKHAISPFKGTIRRCCHSHSNFLCFTLVYWYTCFSQLVCRCVFFYLHLCLLSLFRHFIPDWMGLLRWSDPHSAGFTQASAETRQRRQMWTKTMSWVRVEMNFRNVPWSRSRLHTKMKPFFLPQGR